MAPTTSAPERRASFDSVSLAKEEAAISASAPRNAGLSGLSKRHWFTAAGLYLLSVGAASVGFYRLGYTHAWQYSLEIGPEGWVQPLPPHNGPLTDLDGRHFVVGPGGFRYVFEGDVIKDDPYGAGYLPRSLQAIPTRPLGKRDALPTPTVALLVQDDGYLTLDGDASEWSSPYLRGEVPSHGRPWESDNDDETPVVAEVAIESLLGSGGDDAGSDSDGAPAPVVVEEVNDLTVDPGVVEVHESSAPAGVVEVLEDDSEPEVVIEESESVASGSDSGDLHWKRLASNPKARRLGRRNASPEPVAVANPPYAIGDDPNAYAGQGDRAVTDGIRRFPKVDPAYTAYLELPRGPDEDRIMATQGGGLRFPDAYYPRPTGGARFRDAEIPDEEGFVKAPVPGYTVPRKHGVEQAEQVDDDHYVVTLTLAKASRGGATPAPTAPVF